MKSERAQAWGFDLIIAVTIFLAGLVFFFLYVLNFPTERDQVFNVLNYEGDIIGESLLSEGFPNGWDSNNVVSIGILSDGKINDTKLLEFYNLEYLKSKRLFNVLNDFYVYFDEPVFVDGTLINGIGIEEVNPSNLVKTTRIVVQNGKIKSLNIHVWN